MKIAATGIVLVFAVSTGLASPPHTDGIEPYYPPEALEQYLKTVPAEERSTLFAAPGDMDWWTDARFGAFICWGPSSMLKRSLGWGRKGPRPGHPSDGKVDVMWFDGLGLHPDTWNAPALLKMIRTLQPGIITNHRFGHPPWHMGDFDGPERSIGRFQTNRPWETCTVIGGGWAWMGDAPAMPLPQAISLLVRCAGGGGNLALGVGPTGDGAFLPDHKKRLLEMGQWLTKYGETIYGTHGGPYMPGPWGAATCKGDTIYLHVLAQWSGSLTLPALPAKILKAEVFTGGAAEVVQRDGSLHIVVKPEELDGLDTVIALTIDRDASEIKPIKTIDLPLTIGAQVTASSEFSAGKAASSMVASDLKEFSEGIMVKSAWSPARDDKAPWIQITCGKPVVVDQIQIREGKFGSASRVEQFVIEVKGSNDWKTIHEGSSLGGDFGLVLPAPVTSDMFRIRFVRWTGLVSVNSVELFKGE